MVIARLKTMLNPPAGRPDAPDRGPYQAVVVRPAVMEVLLAAARTLREVNAGSLSADQRRALEIAIQETASALGKGA
jgi:hypothetical protein